MISDRKALKAANGGNRARSETTAFLKENKLNFFLNAFLIRYTEPMPAFSS
jgi:hypothetical protein